MNDIDIAALVTAERLDLCDFLDDLDPAEWARASLCTGWTIHDVVAHLTIPTRITVRDTITGLIRSRGDFNRMVDSMAHQQAIDFQPCELVEQLRATAGSTRRAPLSNPHDPLVDIVVHGQDIARPLVRTRPMPPARVMPALDHAVKSRFYGGPKQFAHVHLIATDTDWNHGHGPNEIRGTAGDLLLAATGRPSGLANLTGPGVDTIGRQLASTSRNAP